MNVLVTGATGFIGSHLCRALSGAGHRVRALHRTTSPLFLLSGLPVDPVAGDLFDQASLESAMTGVEIVFHCAGKVALWHKSENMSASHVQGTRAVMQAALRAGVSRVVYTSSVAALGIPERNATGREDTIPLMDERHSWSGPANRWPYGYAKHLAENEVRAVADAGLEVVIVNPSAVFGAGDLNLIAGGVIWYIAQGRLPLLNLPGGLNAVHIDDVVAGHLAALEYGRNGERYILGGENLTHARLLETIARVTGRRPPRWAAPLPLLHAAASLADWTPRLLSLPIQPHLLRLAGVYFYYDTRRALSELNLPEPKPVERAVEEAYAWYREHERSLSASRDAPDSGLGERGSRD